MVWRHNIVVQINPAVQHELTKATWAAVCTSHRQLEHGSTWVSLSALNTSVSWRNYYAPVLSQLQAVLVFLKPFDWYMPISITITDSRWRTWSSSVILWTWYSTWETDHRSPIKKINLSFNSYISRRLHTYRSAIIWLLYSSRFTFKLLFS